MGVKFMKEYFKQGDYVTVYRDLDNPSVVLKKYDVCDWKIKEYQQQREKLIAMRRKKNWPNFVIRPIKVGKINVCSMVIKYPFIEGIELEKYLQDNDMDLLTCAKLLQKIEKNVMSLKDMVFLDLANTKNIMLLNKDNDMDFFLIDSDDIQLKGYPSDSISGLVAPYWEDLDNVMGMKKCLNGDYMTKELDIRSIYALFYAIMNGKQLFYPELFERENLNEYEKILHLLKIPENSTLYRRTMQTLMDDVPNELMGDALFELIDNGYSFETYDKNNWGYKHRLVRKK